MKRDDVRRGSRARGASPRLESLEGRLLLYAANGGAWTHPERITFSLVPDGTDTGGTPSVLFQSLNSQLGTNAWQVQFQKAAAIWEQVANINLVQVSDNGAALSSLGNQQGDSNFGDIRIAGASLGSGTLAEAFTPPPLNGGTLACDIEINTAQTWGSSGYDLETVAIHEFGHALGMDHSAIYSADMYAYYVGQKQALTADDISGIQSIYGTRQPDQFSITPNHTATTATDITSSINVLSQISLSSLDIQTANDYHYFKVTVPASTTGTMIVTMQSTNLSELSPRVQVYNSSLQTQGYATAVGAFGATVTTTIPNVSSGQVYYIRATAAGGGMTGAGVYGLQVNFGTGTQAAIAPPNTTVASSPDRGGGSGNDSIVGGNSGGPLGNGIIQIGTLTGKGDALMILPRGGRSTATATSGLVRSSSPTDATLLVAPTTSTGLLDAAIDALHNGSATQHASLGKPGGTHRSGHHRPHHHS